MRHWLNQARENGLSLRMTFLCMLFVSLAVTAVLLFTTYRTIKSFHALSDATDTYIDLQEAADNLLKASDYLTEEAQCYSVVGERKHLDNYFREAQQVRRRDHAIEVMEERMPDSSALTELKRAMEESITLMDREYYAMKLMLLAQGDSDIPVAIRNTTLSEADKALSANEKKRLSQQMLHDNAYYSRKEMIRSHLDQCIAELKNTTHGTQNEMNARMHRDLLWTTVLIVVQSLGLALMLWLTTSLGINPLLKAVEHIKRDQKLPITGAHEFRYLADTYNKMYTAYKRSIDNLSFKASHDELTGVYNRAGYDLIKRSVDLESTAFLLVDADHFKQINDKYGHEVGDQVLQRLAQTLKQNFRSDDYICRIGGDEFVVLMVHISTDVRSLIEQKVIQINQDLAKALGDLPPISVSVGVSLCQETAASPQTMFHEADIALYCVKDNGRNGCCFYNPSMRTVKVK